MNIGGGVDNVWALEGYKTIWNHTGISRGQQSMTHQISKSINDPRKVKNHYLER